MSRLSIDQIDVLLQNPDQLSKEDLGVINTQLESYKTADESDLRSKTQERVDKYFESSDNIGYELDDETKSRYEILALERGEESKLKDANALYFSHIYNNVTPEEFYANEQGYYSEHFKEDDISTSEAYTRIQGEVTKDKNWRGFQQEFYNKLQRKVIDRAVGEGANVLGEDVSHGSAVFDITNELEGHEGYMPDRIDSLYQNSRDMWNASIERYKSTANIAKRTFDVLKEQTGIEESDVFQASKNKQDLLKELSNLPREDINAVYMMLQSLSQKKEEDTSSEDEKGFIQKTGESLFRGTQSTTQAHTFNIKHTNARNDKIFIEELKTYPDWYETGRPQMSKYAPEGWRDKVGQPISKEDKEYMLSQADAGIREVQIEQDLIDIATGQVDPVKTDDINAYWYKGIEGIPFMAQAAMPVFGLPLSVSGEYNSSLREFDKEFPDMDWRTKEGMALVSGAFKGSIDRLQGKFLTGSASSWINRTFNNPKNYSSLTKEFLKEAAINVAAQNIQEAVQDLGNPIAQWVFSNLSEDVPDVDWTSEYEQLKDTRLDTFQGLLLPSLIGAGAASFRNKTDADNFLSDVKGMMAMGIPESKAQEIAFNNKGKSLDEREAAYKEAYKDRKVKQAKDFTNKKDVAMSNEEALNNSTVKSSIDLVQDAEGNNSHTVTNPQGKVIGRTTTYDEALKVAVEHDSNAEYTKQEQEAAVVDMIDYMDALNSGRKIERVDEEGSMQNYVDQGMSIEEAYEHIKIAGMARGEDYSDYKPSDMRIFGANIKEYKDNTYTYTSRIYNGASPITVVEEISEGYLKENIDKDANFEKEIISWKQEYESSTGEKTHEDDTKSLIEWFSDRATDYAINESLDGGRLPASFKTFLNKLKVMMRDVITRAAQMSNMKAEGKLNKSFELALAESLGIDMSGTPEAVKQAEKDANSNTDKLSEPITDKVKRDYNINNNTADNTVNDLKQNKVAQRIEKGEHSGVDFDSEIMNSPRVKQKMYATVNSRQYIDDAISYVQNNGLVDSLNSFRSGIKKNGEELDPVERISVGIVLLEHFNENKELDNAYEVIDILSDIGTRAGQEIQQFRWLANAFSDKSSALMYVQKQLKKAQRKPNERKEVRDAKEQLKDFINKEFNKEKVSKPKDPKTVKDVMDSKEDTGTTFMAAPKKSKRGLKAKFTSQMNAAGKTQTKGVKSAIDKIFDIIEEGDFPNAKQIDNAFQEAYEVPTLSESDLSKYSDLFDIIDQAPMGSDLRADLTKDFMRELFFDLGEVDAVDIAASLWYSSILSNPITWGVRNIKENIWNTGLNNILTSVSMNPLKAHNSVADLMTVMGVMTKGYIASSREAWYHIRTGKTVTGSSDASKFMPNKMAAEKKLKTILGIPMKWYLNPYNYRHIIGRLLVAGDALTFKPSQEGLMTLIARRKARADGDKGDAFNNKVMTLLAKSSKELADYEEQAKNEWNDGVNNVYKLSENNWIKRRVKELQEKSSDGELYEEATMLADRAVFRYAPEGILGKIASGVTAANRNERLAKGDSIWLKALSKAPTLIVPFVNVVANSINQKLDYTPVGLIRAMSDKKTVYEGGTSKQVVKSTDERAMELKKGIIGVSTAYWLLNRDPEDEDALFQIHGKGTGNYYKDQALRETGWLPDSIEVNIGGKKRYFSYRYTSIGLLMSAVGNIHDTKRYHKDWKPKDVATKFAWTMADVSTFIMDDSFIRSVAELTEAMGAEGEEKNKRMEKLFFNKGVGTAIDIAVPLSNAWRGLDRMFGDPYKRDNNGWSAMLFNKIPLARHWNKPAIGAYGVAVDQPSTNLYAEEFDTDPDQVARREATRNMIEQGVFLPNPVTYRNKMDAEQYYNFIEIRGQYIDNMLVKSGVYKMFPSMDKKKVQSYVNKITKKAKKIAFIKVGYNPDEE